MDKKKVKKLFGQQWRTFSDVTEDVPGQNESSEEAIDVNCETSETYLAPNPNEGTAAFGSRVKSDKDGIIVIRR